MKSDFGVEFLFSTYLGILDLVSGLGFAVGFAVDFDIGVSLEFGFGGLVFGNCLEIG